MWFNSPEISASKKDDRMMAKTIAYLMAKTIEVNPLIHG